jgi:hypothetical protein
MIYLVFSQEPGECVPFERLLAAAARFFAAKLERRELGEHAIGVDLSVARPAIAGSFRIALRKTTHEDLMNARDAEARGRAAGMSALAEKCATVWVIDAAGAEPPTSAAFLTLAAICASVALGPVLPPDGATLFGVRGAIERRDRALAAS